MKFNLACPSLFIGDPSPKVQWQKDGKPVRSSRRVRLYEDFKSHCLEIKECEAEDSGEYTCTATNIHGSNSCVIRVNIDGSLDEKADEVYDAPSEIINESLDKKAEETEVPTEKEEKLISKENAVEDKQETKADEAEVKAESKLETEEAATEKEKQSEETAEVLKEGTSNISDEHIDKADKNLPDAAEKADEKDIEEESKCGSKEELIPPSISGKGTLVVKDNQDCPDVTLSVEVEGRLLSVCMYLFNK